MEHLEGTKKAQVKEFGFRLLGTSFPVASEADS
jgi:hypothetical protein